MYDGKIGLYLLEQIEQAREFIAEQEFDTAIYCLREALGTLKGVEETYSEEVVKMCKLLGLCYRKKNMLEEGIKALRKAEELCRKKYLKKNDIFWRRELAICYVNEAIIYDSQEKFNKAIGLYENAIELFKELEDNESRVKAMLSLGVAYSKVNDNETVKALYEEALNIINSDFTLEDYRVLFYKMQEDILNKKEKI